MSPGRPTIYSQELADKICAGLTDGRSLRDVCSEDGMPSEAVVRVWARDNRDGFFAQYAAAREIGYLKMADDLLDIADDARNDWMERRGEEDAGAGWQVNGEHINRSRLRVDTRKWMLSKVLPKVYGDKVTNEHVGKDGGPIETVGLSELEIAQRVAFLLTMGTKTDAG